MVRSPVHCIWSVEYHREHPKPFPLSFVLVWTWGTMRYHRILCRHHRVSLHRWEAPPCTPFPLFRQLEPYLTMLVLPLSCRNIDEVFSTAATDSSIVVAAWCWWDSSPPSPCYSASFQPRRSCPSRPLQCLGAQAACVRHILSQHAADECWHFVCSSASARNCQCSTLAVVFSKYCIYIFPREKWSLSCLRLI
jgi:hypothetical protein